MKEDELIRVGKQLQLIRLPEGADERILSMSDRNYAFRKHKRMKVISVAACFLLILLVPSFLLWQGVGKPVFTVTAYACEKEAGEWVKLKQGEKALLQPVDDGNYGEIYAFELDLPENYRYEREGVIMGNDFVHAKGRLLLWYSEEYLCCGSEGEYPLPEHMDSSLRIRIYDDQENWVDTLILQMTKEKEKCYVELFCENIEK